MSEDFLPTHNPCPNCGGIVSADSKFCKHCAFNLAEPVQTLPQRDAPDGRAPSRNKYLLMAGGLVLALALTFIAVLGYRNRHGNAARTPASSQTMGEKATRLEERILRGEALTGGDIAGLSAYELRMLRNVHFARHGRSYDKPGLGDYFYTRPWYKPDPAYNDKLITATDKANISLILPEENRLKAAEAASATTTPVTNAPVADTSSTSIGSSFSSGLTTDNVQRAVDAILDWTKTGGTARVMGIQEVPQQSMARVDIRFEDFLYNSTDLGTPVSKNKTTPPQPDIKSPNYWGEMSRHTMQKVKVTRYSGEGVGILKHYNDGRWVLTNIQFNFVGVNGNVAIQ